MKILIVGGAETTSTLVNLLGEDVEMTIIEKDEAIAKALANQTNALIINGDGTDLSILKEGGILEADAVIITTGDDTTNLMISQIAKTQNVKKIIPLVKNPQNEELFTKLGITSLVSVAGSNARDINRLLQTFGDARIVAQVGSGKVQIIEEVLSKNSKLIGKKAEINNAVVATIFRGDELLIPESDTVLQEDDLLLVAAKTKDVHGVVEIIKGE